MKKHLLVTRRLWSRSKGISFKRSTGELIVVETLEEARKAAKLRGRPGIRIVFK